MSRIQSTDQSTTSSFSTSLESYSPSLSDSSELSVTVDHDPAVIVGLACRVPGARNPSQLWSLIEEQRDVQRKMPADRFNVDGFYHPNSANKGTVSLQTHEKHKLQKEHTCQYMRIFPLCITRAFEPSGCSPLPRALSIQIIH